MTKNAIITRLVIFLLAAGGIGYLYYDHDQKVKKEKAKPKGVMPLDLIEEIERVERPERGRVGSLPEGVFTNRQVEPAPQPKPTLVVPAAGPVMPSLAEMEKREIYDAIRLVKVTPIKERTIIGTVRFEGRPPAEIPLQLTKEATKLFDASYPGREKKTRFYRLGKEGGLGDVLVKLDGELPEDTGSWGAKTVDIRQKGMMYDPYISVANSGQKIRIHNDDPEFHRLHIHGTHFENGEIMQMMFPQAPPYEAPLTWGEENIALTSDQYPWMYGYIHIMMHKYFALTKDDGKFVLPVPKPGKYKFAANHVKLGVASQEVQIGETGGFKVEFTFKLP